jgi:protein SCO1
LSYLCVAPKYPSTLLLLGALSCQHTPSSADRATDGAPAALAAAALTDQDGRPLRFADFQGKTVVLSFFFASCPSVCPRQTRALADVQRKLSSTTREHVRFVSLTVDPDNDSSERLSAFARKSSVDLNSWAFVRANDVATTALTKELAVFGSAPNGEAAPAGHTTSVYLFDGSGHLMQRYAGAPLDTSRLTREIEQLDGWFRSSERELGKVRL